MTEKRHLTLVESALTDYDSEQVVPRTRAEKREPLPPKGARADMDTDALFREYIQRVDYIQAELDDAQLAMKDLLEEFKRDGFDPKALKEALKLRKLPPDKRERFVGLLGTYTRALGIQLDLPFGGPYRLRWGAGAGE